MRWIKFDSSANGVFSREVCPEDAEFLSTHWDTFKCMWREQTQCYWIRLVISLREYINSHIYTYEFLQRFPTSQDLVKAVVDNTFMDICDKFVFEGYGLAKELMLSIMFVMANRDFMAHIGTRPISNDPFYNQSTKNAFRTVFGKPDSVHKIQFHAFLTVNVFSRFASAVVSVLRCWVNEPDCTLLNFYTLYLRDPYWHCPTEWCPEDPLYKHLESKFVFWSAPELEELRAVMEKAPDRATGFREVASLVPCYDVEGIDYSDSDSDTDYDDEHDNLLFAISDQLAETDDDLHDDLTCEMCQMKRNLKKAADQMRREVSDEKARQEFWQQKKVLDVLKLAEEKFKAIMEEKGLKPRKFRDVPPSSSPKKKKNNKKKKGRSASVAGNSANPPAPVAQTELEGSCAKPSPISRVAIEDTAESKAMMAKAVDCLKQVNLGAMVNGAATNGAATNGLAAKTSPAKAVAKAAATANGTTKCCAYCKRSEGCKLKRCSLCVRKGLFPPAYYCSQECQMDDWEESHQYTHADDLEDSD
uniref:MYND-type domain-containing protein n=1 Tax=Ixodes ricinus TaxID=34613 RepID=A0A131XX79_IXORI